MIVEAEFYGSCRNCDRFPEGTSSIDDKLSEARQAIKKVLMIWICMQLAFKRGELSVVKRKF
jgi:hypothetical protein